MFRRIKKAPTDIADIIAEVEEEKMLIQDSDGAEQRFQPSFYGPFGRPYQQPQPPAPVAPPPRQQQQFAPAASHLPPVAPPPKISNTGRQLSSQRSPFYNVQQPSYVEPIEDNSILGSGNFEVISGGYCKCLTFLFISTHFIKVLSGCLPILEAAISSLIITFRHP